MSGHISVGLGGTGYFEQSGGTVTSADGLYVGYYMGSNGTYNHSGGTNIVSNLFLGENSGASGEYILSDNGQLTSSGSEYVGYIGSGTFTQSGGSNTIFGNLSLGRIAGGSQQNPSNGTYTLTGTGRLSATAEFIGYAPGSVAFFDQTGGTNAMTFLSTGTGGRYRLAGGSIEIIGGGFSNQGVFDGGNMSTVINMGRSAIVNFSKGSIINAGSLSLFTGADSLVIVDPGFDPASVFGTYSNLGMTHTQGSTLIVPASQGFCGSGWIDDPVECHGSITANTGGFVSLSNRLLLSDSGTINLGDGILTTNDRASTISGGSLVVTDQFVGDTGTGVFTQSGGSNMITGWLILGRSRSDDDGTYILSGSGEVSTAREAVGYQGKGTFIQSGGTHIVSEFLCLGFSPRSSGSFYLNGGTLVLPSLFRGSGTGNFNFNGGTLRASGGFSTTLPMKLGTSGGGATIDTDDFAITLAGSLSGSGSLAKVGDGVLILTSSNTFTGATTVGGGKLVVNGSLASPTVNVGGGAKLGGTGSLAGKVTVAGGNTASTQGGISLVDAVLRTITLSDTNSADTALTLGGTTANTPSLLEFEVGATADRILVSMAKLMVNEGGATINITPLDDFHAGVYDLINFGSGKATGLDRLMLGTTTLPGYKLSLQSTATAEQLVVSAVPEPSTLTLLGVGVMSLVRYGWRQRSRGKTPRRQTILFECRLTKVSVSALLIAASTLYCGSTARAQMPYPVEWIAQVGTINNDAGRGVWADNLGQVYLCGYTNGNLGRVNAGFYDAYITSLSTTGSIRWTRQFGTSSNDIAFGVTGNNLGDVFLTGVNGNSLFVCKLDPTGNTQWMREINGGGVGHGVSADGQGNAFFAGSVHLNVSSMVAIVGKYDAAGTLLWSRQIGTSSVETAYSVSSDPQGNVFTGGSTGSSLGMPNAGSLDAFVSKFDASGALLWTRQLGTTGSDECCCVANDAQGNVFLCGNTQGSLAGALRGGTDAFVAKYDAAGNQLWANQFGTSGTDYANSLSIDGQGNVCVVGATDGNLGGPNQGHEDAFACEFSSEGIPLWTTQFGTAFDDLAYGISTAGPGRLYICGDTAGGLNGHVIENWDGFVMTTVPEPSTFALLGASLIGLIGYAWRRWGGRAVA